MVMFLHGFTGAGGAWPGLPGVRALCPDLPGHNGAPLPQQLGREGFEATLTSLAEQLTAPSVVIGYSQGARLALALAIRFPKKVSRLVLESGTPGLTRHHDRALRQAEDEARARLIEEHGVAAFIAQWERQPLFAGIPPSAGLEARRRAHTAAGLAGALRCLGLGAQPSFWPQLPALRIPTLLLTGARDEKFCAIASKMATQLALSWHVSVPGVGHAVHLEAPQRWAAEVGAFIATPFTPEHLQEIRT